MAVTDIPSVSLAQELILAYPSAKVILNRRLDVEAWYRSVLNTVENGGRGLNHTFLSLFDSELFWIHRLRQAVWSEMFNHDFRKYGKECYVSHYQELEELLEREAKEGRKRDVLRWSVEEGWGPLVRFLGKEVPRDEMGQETEFPSGNDPGEFAGMRRKISEKRLVRAETRRRVLVFAVLSLFVAVVGWWWHAS